MWRSCGWHVEGAWSLRALVGVVLCCSVVATPLDSYETQLKARTTLESALDSIVSNHMLASSFADSQAGRPESTHIGAHAENMLVDQDGPSRGVSLGESAGLGMRVRAPTVPTTAQLVAAKPAAQRLADNMRATLLKPPGCRPTGLEISQYSRVRTNCATSIPRRQTKIRMKILRAALVEISAKTQSFTMGSHGSSDGMISMQPIRLWIDYGLHSSLSITLMQQL